jgi:hypothetical protein
VNHAKGRVFGTVAANANLPSIDAPRSVIGAIDTNGLLLLLLLFPRSILVGCNVY